MKQKFMPLEFVRIAKELPSHSSHYPADTDAIVVGSYSQLLGGSNITDYQLYIVRDGRVTGSSAWHFEEWLTRLEHQDAKLACEMIEAYNLSKKPDMVAVPWVPSEAFLADVARLRGGEQHA